MSVDLIVPLVAAGVGLVACGLLYAFHARRSYNAVNGVIELKEQRLLGGEVIRYLPDELAFRVFDDHFIGEWFEQQQQHRSGPEEHQWDHQSNGGFQVVQLQLNSVEAVFLGKRQEWCRTYDSAVALFGSTPASAALRTQIHNEHATLAGKPAAQQGVLRSLDELKTLLAFGRKPNGEPAVFTYVLTVGGEWRFSRTGDGPLRNNLSKHAVHSDAAESVVYAGEFSFDAVADQLTIDNCSGAYAPDASHLPLMAEVLQRNFPELKVKAAPSHAEEAAKIGVGAGVCATLLMTPLRSSPARESCTSVVIELPDAALLAGQPVPIAPSMSSTSGLSSSSIAHSGTHPLHPKGVGAVHSTHSLAGGVSVGTPARQSDAHSLLGAVSEPAAIPLLS